MQLVYLGSPAISIYFHYCYSTDIFIFSE
jgi:hypothetical protein